MVFFNLSLFIGSGLNAIKVQTVYSTIIEERVSRLMLFAHPCHLTLRNFTPSVLSSTLHCDLFNFAFKSVSVTIVRVWTNRSRIDTAFSYRFNHLESYEFLDILNRKIADCQNQQSAILVTIDELDV